MKKIPEDYVEKVYAGWLGKIIGVRHGANIEGWTYERIKRAFGEIDGYIHQFKNFAADDDINGPAFFQMALQDFAPKTISGREMGLTWLNYVPDGHGFFWWGGYGNSTEHTAYINMKNGIMPPRSGSIEQNGATVAEQIGGQIFSDCWGLVAPGNPRLAADYAHKMSSVSHGGNGIYGGMFVAAAIAAAFTADGVKEIIESGLAVIPDDSEYAVMRRDIIHFYREHPRNWRDCFHFVQDNYGYRHYPGNVHIIPNSAIIILALLYSQGDYSKAINISNMCGWDTDCNVGNIGTITGVLNGIDGISDKWKRPVNDFVCSSSVLGSLNILDIPWLASLTANLGYRIAGEEPPEDWRQILGERKRYYHFEYPGSTQAFRVENDGQASGFIENSREQAHTGQRSLKLVFDNANGGHGYRAYQQTYYTPEDFDDSRYDPAFSPVIYPGQGIETMVYLPKTGIEKVKARMFVQDRNSGQKFYSSKFDLVPGEWVKIDYTIPVMKGACLQKAGVELIPLEEERWRHLDFPSLIVYIDDFKFKGKPDYSVDFSGECIEEWHGLHKEVSQLTYLRGIWTLEDGELSGSFSGEPAEAYTGDVYWEDYVFKTEVKPILGEYHNINFRVQGAIRSYAAGLAPDGQLKLYKNNNGYEELASTNFSWQQGETYMIEVKASSNNIIISVEDELLIEYIDEDSPYLTGQIGFSNFAGSHTHYSGFELKGI
ncbi:MAG: ADP-ribosylglycohydrolase family protein [Halanaerobiales bacterium]